MARKILLADDSVTAQNMGRKILADAGYEVITVNNGSAALKKIAEAKPDIIILDVYMPGYSGLEVCQRLKEVQETSRIPILLTVGKLEPFKPEEAKRVRAEGFIVKPFEASELLAALAKLEDKIVPRAEASKPGRFARANAAIDEGRAYDKTVAGEEDSGWKNRISFPSKKKKATEPEETEDPAIYNAVNKDLRTKVEPKVAGPVEPYEQQKVDLGALAPEGLPKDVTPEEIAALAAAAAQVKGKLNGEGTEAAAAPLPASDLPTAEFKAAEIKAEEATKVSEPTPEIKTEAVAAQASEAEQLAASLAATMPAEMVAAIAAQDSEVAKHAESLHQASQPPAEEPVTMAVAAGASNGSSRWTAVSVALAGDEAAISLEQEMQKAHAAFAAAENSRSGSVLVMPDRPVVAEPTPEISSSAPLAAEPVAAVHEPAALTLSPEAIAAAETMRAVVRQFETVSAPKSEPSAEPAPVTVSEIVAATEMPAPEQTHAPEVTAPESIAPAETSAVATESADVAQPAPYEPPAAELASAPSEQPQEAAKQEEPRIEEAKLEQANFEQAKLEEANLEEAKPEESRAEEARHERPAPDSVVAQSEAEQSSSASSALQETSVVSESPAPVEQAVSPEPEAASLSASPAAHTEKTSKESEIHETTAAAWASWRRIRESGDGRSASDKSGPESDPRDLAAMAVAAGAEKAPEDSSNSEDPGEIANIVDSVLADLRPKIVAEISKKMGKKK